MVDSLFQGFGAGAGGTHNAIMSTQDYLSTAQRYAESCVVHSCVLT